MSLYTQRLRRQRDDYWRLSGLLLKELGGEVTITTQAYEASRTMTGITRETDKHGGTILRGEWEDK